MNEELETLIASIRLLAHLPPHLHDDTLNLAIKRATIGFSQTIREVSELYHTTDEERP